MLQGNKTYLSPLRTDESEQLFTWINDRDLLTHSAPYKPTHHNKHLEWFNSLTSRSDLAIFGIRSKSDDVLVGTCQLHSISQIHRSAELQIRIGAEGARGKGFGKDACKLLLHHGFNDLNLHRIYLHVLATTIAARALYKSVGLTFEGKLRDAVFIDSVWTDVVLMGILRREYLAE